MELFFRFLSSEQNFFCKSVIVNLSDPQLKIFHISSLVVNNIVFQLTFFWA